MKPRAQLIFRKKTPPSLPRTPKNSGSKPLDIWKRAERAATANKHNTALARVYDSAGIKYEREYQAIPGRKYRWDFHLLRSPVLIEVQGGIYMGKGAHNTAGAMTRDAEKNNEAATRGWYVLYFVPEMIEDGRALLYTQRALRLVNFGSVLSQ